MSRAGKAPARALAVGGSDSGAGAGIQADLATFAAFGVLGSCAVTALTAQSPERIAGVQVVDAAFVGLQMRTVLADLGIAAIKTGMLATAPVVVAVAAVLADAARGVPVVVDPVVLSGTGTVLLDDEGLRALVARLLPLTTVVTPNLPEAALLLGLDPASAAGWSSAKQEEAGRQILSTGVGAVLVKGGHRLEGPAADVLVQRDCVTWLEAPRVAAGRTHGTGCRLASALAACLALGQPLERAARSAKDYLTSELRRHDRS